MAIVYALTFFAIVVVTTVLGLVVGFVAGRESVTPSSRGRRMR